jgi:hypothetical protein
MDATPLALVTAVPTCDPSTVNVTVAPETVAPPEVWVSVALRVTGPVEPNVTEAGLGADRVSAVATFPLTVKENVELSLFQLFEEALYWPLTLALPLAVGVRVVVQLELLLDPIWTSVHVFDGEKVPFPRVRLNFTAPCGYPLGAPD